MAEGVGKPPTVQAAFFLEPFAAFQSVIFAIYIIVISFLKICPLFPVVYIKRSYQKRIFPAQFLYYYNKIILICP